MATILRSSKYARCLNVFARRLLAGHDNGDFGRKLVALQARCVGPHLAKSYATAPVLERNDAFTKIDSQVAKLDEHVQRYGRIFSKDIVEILTKFQTQGSIGSLDGLLLVRCCGDLMVDCLPEVKNQLVQEVWSMLETLNTPIDVSHFNALLRVYLENNHEFSPVEIVAKMKDKGIEPNRVTYQRLIQHYCKKGDIEGATKILEFMREKGHPLNEGVFNALITGHSEANDMDSAIKMLNVMNEAGVAPTSNTYTALLCAHAKRGDMASIKKLIDECEAKDLFLYNKDLFEVIKVLATSGHDSGIDELLTMMPRGPRYNYDAFHAIMKILDVGNVDAAVKILLTMDRHRKNTEEEAPEIEETVSGTFLVRKMVNSKIPADKLMEVCDQLEKLGQHPRAFTVALERSLQDGNTALSLELLKKFQDRGETIREHYLWPVLASHGKAANFQGVCDVLKFMTTELKMVPQIETITDFVLPYFSGTWDQIVSVLKEYDIPHTTIVNSIATRMLMDNKIRKTANFMLSYPSDYDATRFYRPLGEALKNTEDTHSFVVILQLLHESAIDQAKARGAEDGSAEESRDSDGQSVIDTAVLRASLYIPYGRFGTLCKLVNDLHEAGMKVSPAVGQEIIAHFQNDMTAEIKAKIEELSQGSLELKPRSQLSTSNLDKENKMLSGDGQQQGSAMFSIKRQQLNTALANRDGEAVRSLIEAMNANGFTFAPSLFAQIISFFCDEADMEQAEKWMNKYKSEHPGNSLDLHKTMQYAELLVKNGRVDDAVKFVEESPREDNNALSGVYRLSRRVLDQVAETGDVENTKKMLNALVASKFCALDGSMLGTVVRAHLIRNDLEGALEAFENICQNYKCTPMKNELSKKLIAAEDAKSLQRLTDLSTQIHGESNSLIDLVQSFIECGRLRQARKIMETPGLRVRGTKIRVIALRYVEEDMHNYLDQFVELSKGLPVFDRQELYDVLIDVYSNKNDWEHGLSLWTLIQEENIQPSPHFLDTLAKLLVKNGKAVPFNHAATANETEVKETKPRISSDAKPNGPSPMEVHFAEQLEKAIEDGDLEKAESIIAETPLHYTEYTTMASRVADAFLSQRQDLDKACKILQNLITLNKRAPRAYALKRVWHALIEAERYDELQKFDDIMGAGIKRKFRFAKFLSRGELKKIGITRYLTNLEARIAESRSVDLGSVKRELHFASLIQAIRQEPHVLPEVGPIVEKLANHEVFMPMNVVWSYYFEENKPEADEIWDKYLSTSQYFSFNHLIASGLETNDPSNLERLHQKLSDSAVSIKGRSSVLSALVEIYSKNERYDDAVNLLQNASPKIVEDMKMNFPHVIEQLKSDLEANGKSLPRAIAGNK